MISHACGVNGSFHSTTLLGLSYDNCDLLMPHVTVILECIKLPRCAWRGHMPGHWMSLWWSPHLWDIEYTMGRQQVLSRLWWPPWWPPRRSPALIYEIWPYISEYQPKWATAQGFPWIPTHGKHVGIIVSAGDLGCGSRQWDQTMLTVHLQCASTILHRGRMRQARGASKIWCIVQLTYLLLSPSHFFFRGSNEFSRDIRT